MKRATLKRGFSHFFKIALKAYARVLKEMAKRQDLADYLEKLELEITDCFIPIDSSDFQTIIHGDCWINNYMFKYDEDKTIADVKVLDWQITCKSDPVKDLLYLFGSSLTPQFRKQHLEDLLKFYHRELETNMTNLGYNLKQLYPFDIFRQRFEEYKLKCYGLFYFFLMVNN